MLAQSGEGRHSAVKIDMQKHLGLFCCAVAVLTLLALGWMFRWKVINPGTPPNTAGIVYRVPPIIMNRWTGEIRMIDTNDGDWVIIKQHQARQDFSSGGTKVPN